MNWYSYLKPGFASANSGGREDEGQIGELGVAPLVELGQGGAGTALLVEHDGWDTEAHEALEE